MATNGAVHLLIKYDWRSYFNTGESKKPHIMAGCVMLELQVLIKIEYWYQFFMSFVFLNVL